MQSRRNLLFWLVLMSPAGGCQLTTPDNMKSPANTAGLTPSNSKQLELPPKKSAEICLATAESLEKAAQEYEIQGNKERASQDEKAAKQQYDMARQSDIEAIALYEKARQNGTQRQVGRRLAALYDKVGESGRALEEYQKLLKHSSKDADLLNDVGYCYYNQGKWTEAEKYLRQAVAANDKLARAWINLGMTLAQEQKNDQSLEAFAKVVSPAQARCNLAFIWMTQGKFEMAKAAYRQALAQEPNLTLARAALAKLDQPARNAAPQATGGAPLQEAVEDMSPIVLP